MRPRVQTCAGGVARLLEDEVAELLAAGRAARVVLCGAPQSGKSTALAHLAAVFAGEARLGLRDGRGMPATDALVEVATLPGVVSAPGTPRQVRPTWMMAKWSDDDCLEYLCSRHKERTAVAFARWQACSEDHGLYRWPGHCTAVLDLLAGEDLAADAWQSLRLVVQRTTADEHAVLGLRALQQFLAVSRPIPAATTTLPSATGAAWLQSEAAAALLAAEALLDDAAALPSIKLASLRWQRRLAVALHVVMQMQPRRREHLRDVLEHAPAGIDLRLPLSLLAATEQGFRPPRARFERLAHAMLAYADLHDVTIAGDCSQVNLAFANLRGATLDGALLTGAHLEGADVWGASLERAQAARARAANVIADGVRGDDVQFAYADLCGARFVGASLRRAVLTHARLRGTNFTSADLRGADLSHTDLREVVIEGVDLAFTKLHRVNAEGVEWPKLAAKGSDWADSQLTGARWHEAQLDEAAFHRCGLAHVDWQGANLRGADLRQATFHLGNARSGLVGSEIACEGSRTGFYTDESLDDLVLQPEVVRQANLSECDLRGALLDDVDLYRVDLRGARLDPAARDWARRCRAILDDPPRG